MALPLLLGWIGTTVGGLVLLALIDVGRALMRRVTRLRSHRVGTTSLEPEAASSPSRAR